ncbi:MAG: hypothetical protein BWY76_01313 [bacterium ADurb.Bin429]|nr:MAG: hypothetical protein BWY76_01313 [bacterium ADurb.Bin429]
MQQVALQQEVIAQRRVVRSCLPVAQRGDVHHVAAQFVGRHADCRQRQAVVTVGGAQRGVAAVLLQQERAPLRRHRRAVVEEPPAEERWPGAFAVEAEPVGDDAPAPRSAFTVLHHCLQPLGEDVPVEIGGHGGMVNHLSRFRHEKLIFMQPPPGGGVRGAVADDKVGTRIALQDELRLRVHVHRELHRRRGGHFIAFKEGRIAPGLRVFRLRDAQHVGAHAVREKPRHRLLQDVAPPAHRAIGGQRRRRSVNKHGGLAPIEANFRFGDVIAGHDGPPKKVMLLLFAALHPMPSALRDKQKVERRHNSGYGSPRAHGHEESRKRVELRGLGCHPSSSDMGL